MNNELYSLLTPENILSYVCASIEIGEKLFDLHSDYQRVIIPSRGAYSFYYFANTSLDSSETQSHCLFRRYGAKVFGVCWAIVFGEYWATFQVQL